MGRTERELTEAERAELLEKARLQSAKEQRLTELLGAGDLRGLTLMKSISQGTFDEAVRENMEEFGMTREEAINDAIAQFQAQGATLDKVQTTTTAKPPAASK